VVAQLVQLVTQYGFNGVDLNFEGNLNSRAQQDFLITVTKGLVAQLPRNSEITHTPMDIQTVAGHPYHDVVLPAIKNDLSFLMIQYYNGIIDPQKEWAEMRGHYRHLLSGFFGDDPTRLVAGVCLSVCGDFDVTSEDALVVIQNLEALGTPTGGIFFWASSSNMYFPHRTLAIAWRAPPHVRSSHGLRCHRYLVQCTELRLLCRLADMGNLRRRSSDISTVANFSARPSPSSRWVSRRRSPARSWPRRLVARMGHRH
jgi:hypothetical protein